MLLQCSHSRVNHPADHYQIYLWFLFLSNIVIKSIYLSCGCGPISHKCLGYQYCFCHSISLVIYSWVIIFFLVILFDQTSAKACKMSANVFKISWSAQINGLVQESNSIGNALELRLFRTNPLKWQILTWPAMLTRVLFFGLHFCCCFATRKINTKITLSWALKQFFIRVHTLFSIN